MTTEKSILITHNGTTYHGQLATIHSTTLGYEDHGIMTALLHCRWANSGVAVGGYCLDKPNWARDDGTRIGTAYGHDHIIRIINTVGVDKWEDLKGASVIVLFEKLYEPAKGIAGVHNDQVLILAEHAEEWK